eukprot:COSAG04_NODE_253_length_18812_cov_10.793043_4_plen_221_part_00
MPRACSKKKKKSPGVTRRSSITGENKTGEEVGGSPVKQSKSLQALGVNRMRSSIPKITYSLDGVKPAVGAAAATPRAPRAPLPCSGPAGAQHGSMALAVGDLSAPSTPEGRVGRLAGRHHARIPAGARGGGARMGFFLREAEIGLFSSRTTGPILCAQEKNFEKRKRKQSSSMPVPEQLTSGGGGAATGWLAQPPRSRSFSTKSLASRGALLVHYHVRSA